MLARGLRYLSLRSSHSNIQKPLDAAATSVVPGSKEAWDRRLKLRKPKLQRDEILSAKVYYAPEWELDRKSNKDAGFPDPLKNYGMNPEKWEYYNKVVWPPNYIVPETGLPKLREVFHCRESIHFSPKRMWQACQLVWRTNVDEAITQLNFQQIKSCKILAEVLSEAKERAEKEFHIEYPSEMYVADAFPIQCNIIKGARRHAHENWCTIRYRYINVFVRLEEGDPPPFRTREKLKNGWEHMEAYYKYLRSRSKKYNCEFHGVSAPLYRTYVRKFVHAARGCLQMVNVKKGVLVTCDPAMRQLLMHLDESRTLGSKFIVKELDETHLFIDREIVRILEEKLDHLMEQMNPELTDK